MLLDRRNLLRFLAGCSSAVTAAWTLGCDSPSRDPGAGTPDAGAVDATRGLDAAVRDGASGTDQGLPPGPDAASLPASVVDQDGGTHECAVDLCLDLKEPANAKLLREGGAVVIRDAPNGDGIIVGRDQGELFATSAVCTHLGCYLTFSDATRDLLCPCHASLFAKTGEVLRGPARRGLRVYSVTTSADGRYVVVTL